MADEDSVSLEFLTSFGDAWNAHDVDAIMAHMSADCVFQPSVGEREDGACYEGAAAARRGVERFFEQNPDAHFEPVGAFVAGNRGVSEWIYTGTRSDGNKLRVRGCDVFTFEGGKIKVKNAFRKQRP